MSFLNKATIGAVLLAALSWGGAATAETPTEVKVGAIFAAGPDVTWDGTMIDTLKAMKGQSVDGVKITKTAYIDGVWGDAAQAAMRRYAKRYDIVWAHSSYGDQIKKIYKKFPDTMFVMIGSGNEVSGKNTYLVYNRIFEQAYIAGVIAGTDTKTNTIGAIAGFASDEVNDVINAFFAGAKSANPNIKQKVTFIESWWDPPLAFEASTAQIAAGVDQMVMLSDAYEGCKQGKIVCYGTYRDVQEIAPETIGGSLVTDWEPHLRWVIKEWKRAKESGQWNASKEPVELLMKDGTGEFVIGKGVAHSPEALTRAKELSEKIMSGNFKVPLDSSLPTSN